MKPLALLHVSWGAPIEVTVKGKIGVGVTRLRSSIGTDRKSRDMDKAHG